LTGGFENLGNLNTFHLRKNQIVSFEDAFPPLENLVYLNLRDNKIANLEEFLKI